MIPQFNAIVLDVIVIVLLLSLIALGAFKGIKHIAINFVLFLASIALSFTSFMSVLRKPITDLLPSIIKLGVGVSSENKLGVYLLYNLLASTFLTLLFYLILRLMKLLIVILLRRQRIKNNKLIATPHKLSRIFGGLFSFVFNGILVVLLLSVFSNQLIGGNKTMENTYVSKYVEELDDLIIDKVSDDDLIEEKVMYRLINGNLYMKVDDDQASNLASISSLVSEGKLVPENLDNVQETLDYLRHILSFTVNNAINDSGVENDGFEEFVKLTRNTVQDSINAMNKLHEGEPIEAEGTLVIDNLLKKLDLNNVEEVFANVFVIK